MIFGNASMGSRIPRAASARLMIALMLGFWAVAGLQAQQNTDYVTGANSTGRVPYRAYGGARENIDLHNLNVQVVIPLLELAGRNGLDLPVMAAHNSTVREWVERQVMGETRYYHELVAGSGGPYFDLDLGPSLVHISDPYQQGGNSWDPNRYIIRETDGTRLQFQNKDYDSDVPSWVASTLEWMRSTDASFQQYRETSNSSDGVAISKSGTQTTFASARASRIRDTNGNLITFTHTLVSCYATPPVTQATSTAVDSLGRKVRLEKNYDCGNSKWTSHVLKVQDNATPANDYGQVWTLIETGSTSSSSTWELRPPSWASSGVRNANKFVMTFQDVGPLRNPLGVVTLIYDRRLTQVSYPFGGYTRYDWALSSDQTKTVLTGRCIEAADSAGERCTQYVESPRQVVRPDGSWTRHSFDPEGKEIEVEHFGPSWPGGALLRTVDKTWDISKGSPLLTEVTTTLDNNLQSEAVYVYDSDGYPRASGAYSNGNVIEEREYDFGWGAPGALLRKTTRSWLGGPTYGINGLHVLDRMTLEDVWDGSTLKSRTSWTYDDYSGAFALVGISGAVNRDAAFGTGYTTRGNLSRESRWLNTTGTNLDTRYGYDVAGNRRKEVDPRGYQTTWSYGSATQFGFPSSVTRPNGLITSYTYDFDNAIKWGYGYRLTTTDPNNQTTAWTYDLMGRVKTQAAPDQGLITHYYSDLELTARHGTPYVFNQRTSVLPPRARSFTKIDASLNRVDSRVYDGLGRLLLTGVGPLDGVSPSDWTRTEYDGNERAHRTSNPFTLTLSTSQDYPTSTSGLQWTTRTFDGLGRVTRVTHPDGDYFDTAYSGNTETATDPVGAKRKLTRDALGRITSTVEPNPSTGSLSSGAYTTNYAYDVKNNLLSVTQGSQTRSFTYDSLSRPTVEQHPELIHASVQGQVSYGYDANSNLTSKTDARGVVVTYSYDDLDRLTGIGYSDGTPSVSYTYDSASVSNGKGRRTGMSDGAGGTTFHYDPVGRTSKIVWSTSAFSQTGEFEYNFNGGITESRWPGIWDGPSTPLTIYYGYDDRGRQKSAYWSNNGGGAFQPLVDDYSFLYSSTGSSATQTLELANDTTETVTYNNRRQPTQRRLTNPAVIWQLDYSYLQSCAGNPNLNENNGNVYGIDENTPGISGKDQTYCFDYLNRLTSATNPGGWGLSFTMDRYGNRPTQSGTGGAPTTSVAISTISNRITTAGYGYDAAGNLTSEPGFAYQFDAENRMSSVSGSTAATYVYDGDGRRTKRTANGETRWYFYDALGHPIWEYESGFGWETFNFFFQGRQLAINNGEGLRWRHLDNLGSLRVKTDPAGSVQCRYWYLPYGQLESSSCTEADARRFTGKERDPETGLDYFVARYYASDLGRFASTDPLLESGEASDPQTWNRYPYTSNNPTNRVDPDGRKWFVKDGEEPVWVDPDDDGNYTSPGEGWTPVEGSFTRVVGNDVLRYSKNGPIVYVEQPGLIDNTAELVGFLGFTRELSRSLFRGLFSSPGTGARAVVGQARTFATKAEAREFIGRVSVSQAQKAAASRAVRRATTSTTIEIVKRGDSLVVRNIRPGANGYQVLESIIDSQGGKTVVQKAYDSARRLVHYDPK